MKLMPAYLILIAAFALQGAGCIINNSIQTYTDASYEHARSMEIKRQSQPAMDFIRNHGEFIREMAKCYKISPEIIMAVGMYESSFGRSNLALRACNLHGIKAGDDWDGPVYVDTRSVNWRAWSSTNEGIEGFCQYICQRVPRFIGKDITPKEFAYAYGCGNPAEYAQNIELIINRYGLRKLYRTSK
jgi:hypothetical protein